MTRRTLGAGLAVAVGVLAAGTAWAYWTAAGSGTGGATAGTAESLETVATLTQGRPLFPGGRGDVKINIQNRNPTGCWS